MQPTFRDFLTQVPPQILALFFTLFVLTILSFIGVLILRTRRKKPPPPPPAVAPASASPTSTENMPDLDALLDTSTLQQPSAPVPPTETVTQPDTATTSPAQPTGDDIPERSKPVLSVVRDESTGEAVVVIDGVAYRSNASTVDEAFAAQFRRAMHELEPLRQRTNSPTQQNAMPSASSAPPRSASSTGAGADAGENMGDLPSYRLDDPPPLTLNTSRRNAPPPPPIPELNLARAIETFLQRKLAQSGAFANRNLHVLNAPGGGVRIEVDGTYYESVDDVEDEAVRAYLQETIAEWQARQ